MPHDTRLPEGTMATFAMSKVVPDSLDREIQALFEGQAVTDGSEEVTLTPARQKILAMMAWANDQAWPGRSGTTDLNAFRAILGVAYRANKLAVAVSQYDLSEWIDVSNRTAWNALQRLQGRGLLRVPNHGRCPKCKAGQVVLKHRGRGGKHWPFYA